MGKVQDTISRIGRRSTTRAHVDIALQVPEQRPATADSFATDPEQVSRYIKNLAARENGASKADLVRALQHSNRLQNTPAARLQIARLFEPAVRRSVTDLTAGFSGVELPYPASAVTDFEHATTLLGEMAASYKVILLDVLRRRGHLPRKHRLPVIYQAMKHLSECGFRFSQSHRPWPEKMWRDLNTLYLCAEREQGVDTILHQGNNPVTIRQLYCQCCAFACCSGAHLPPHYHTRLYRSLGSHSHIVNLTDSADVHNADTLFSIALDSAHPPCSARFSRYQPGQVVRYFDLGPLFDLLPISETGVEYDGTDTTAPGNPAVDHTFVSQIGKVTNAATLRRRHARSVRQTLLHTEAGIKEIHASLHPASGKAALDNADARNYGTQWIIENRSKGGLGLRWTGQGNCRVNVGELIAHCEQANRDSHANLHWHVGIVRWIRTDGKDELLCGVETIANYAAAAITSKVTSAQAIDTPSVTEALLLNEHPATNRPPMLLVPKDLYRIGEQLELQISYSRRFVKLVENFPLAGNFNCFGFQTAAQ